MKRPEEQEHETARHWAHGSNLLEAALHHLASGVVVTDPHQDDNPIIYVNPSFSKLTGYTQEETLGRNCRLLQGPETDSDTVRQIREAVREGRSFRGLLRNYRKDGTSFLNGLLITPIWSDAGGVLAFVGTLSEVGDSREALRALAAQTTRAREDERTSLAREIHDELGQALTGLKMDLAWLDRRLSRPSDEICVAALRERVAEMMQFADATVNTVRRIAAQLRPPALDDLGLEAAIEWHLGEWQKRSGVLCDWQSNLGERELPAEVATAAFRIVQEALTNVARHANASHVQVRLEVKGTGTDEVLHLEVRDDGRGVEQFEVATVSSLGLLGMRERALTAGGELTVERSNPRGTRVAARIPLCSST